MLYLTVESGSKKAGLSGTEDAYSRIGMTAPSAKNVLF